MINKILNNFYNAALLFILMFANTVNKYCPYFNEMGLSGVKKQQQGTIDIYSYPSTDLKIALEYCEDNTKSGGKEHNKYFAFDNPRLKMITTGEWEIDIYPHLPCKFKPSEVSYTFYINFDGDIVECKIIDSLELGFPFIFCHYKSTKLKEKENEDRIVYQKEASPNPLIINNITKPTNKASQFIWSFFQNNKVFYQSNDIGEIVNNYILSCK